MYPEIVSFGDFTLYAYGLLIMTGAVTGYLYLRRTAHQELGADPEKIQMLAVWIILAAFVGGKLFFYLEKPSFYFFPPSNMLVNFRTGFVFYGSLLFAFPVAFWYFRKEKWPVWPMLDLLAITATIVHAFGRMGCFLAGCCYGLPSTQPWGVTFSHKSSKAPLHESLHPTQLYSVFLIVSIFGVLMMFKRHKRFEGQLFFIYIILYAAGRSIIEIFRGDLRRGFIVGDWLSHSQFISLMLVGIVGWWYWRRSRSASLSDSS
ncbi:MAG: prolipoprotein diacylglyceryl transferase [Bacteroidota bacterium]